MSGLRLSVFSENPLSSQAVDDVIPDEEVGASKSTGSCSSGKSFWNSFGCIQLVGGGLFLLLVIILCVALIKKPSNSGGDVHGSSGTSFFTSAPSSPPVLGPSYYSWCVGSCSTPKAPTNTKAGVVLMGGGTDVDAAFIWQIENANGGDFLILRTSGTDAYNPWVYNLSTFWGHPLNSVTTILCNDARAANDSNVIATIDNAAAIFFAGGDQWLYVSQWRGSLLQESINKKLKHITIGGTSAGLAILGGHIFTAQNVNTAFDSHEAMQNPYGSMVTIEPGLFDIPFLHNVLTDTHFVVRNRMGRMLTFLARLMQTEYSSTLSSTSSSSLALAAAMSKRSVGVDQETAMLLNTTSGKAHLVGYNTAYVCHSKHLPSTCTASVPLTFANVSCMQLSTSTYGMYNEFDFNSMTGAYLFRTPPLQYSIPQEQEHPSHFFLQSKILFLLETGNGRNFCNNVTHGEISKNHFGYASLPSFACVYFFHTQTPHPHTYEKSHIHTRPNVVHDHSITNPCYYCYYYADIEQPQVC